MTTPVLTPTHIPLPPPLQVTGDLKANWKKFRQLWDSYEIVTSIVDKPDKFRVATFITAVGKDALDIHNNLPYKSEEEKQNMATILKLWEEHCKGKTNIIYERYKFNNCAQQADERFDHYLVRLRELASTCDYGNLTDDFLRDRIVCGITDNTLRKRLLQESSLTLDKCVMLCKASEATVTHMQAMKLTKDESAEVKFVHQKQKTAKKEYTNNCRYCGKTHELVKTRCPAYGKTCTTCGKMNHFATKCRQGASSQKKLPKRDPKSKMKRKTRVHALDEDTEDSDLDSDFEVMTIDVIGKIDTVKGKTNKKYTNKIMATFMINGQRIKMQVDSGATCNVLPQTYLPVGTKIDKSNKILSLYNNEATIPVVGTAMVLLVNPKTMQENSVPFVIIEGQSTPLIGSCSAQQLNLIRVQHHNIAVINEPRNIQASLADKPMNSRTDVINAYPDVFQGLGHMPGTVHLELDKSATPTVMPPRRVPVALKDKLKTELDRMEERQIITKVVEPTDWVSSLVTVDKPNGKIRICIDPKPLNSALKRGHYPLPVIDDILPQMSGVKVFTKADCKEGFLQCELDTESSYLTTFQTPWGRYRYNRMPFGISPAPEIFQQKLDHNLEGLVGVYKIADDILITGRGETLDEANRDHDKNLHQLLQRCRERHIKLNFDKLEFKSSEVTYMGHVLSSDGLKADPNKVAAIKDMPKPEDVAGVQRFVGMTKYLAKFLPHLSDISEPLRKLTHKDTAWNWTEEHDKALTAIKQCVSEAPVLRYFDPKLATEGQGDASCKGLGFALLQQGQPVTYASRALTAAETRYSQIEKELLALVFGMERNHHYVYGRKITLWTDHKPLVAIQLKPLNAAPKRLQRLLIRLHQYDVEIKYKPGPEMYLADTLSRAYLQQTDRTPMEIAVESIHMANFIPLSKQRLTEIQQATASDSTLQLVIQQITVGWPDTMQECPPETHAYYTVRDELTTQDGIVFKGYRCVIPKKLRRDIRQRLHATHTGLQSTLRRARECVYWPGMNSELKDYVSKCETCNMYQSSQPKEPLISHNLPTRPWEKIGCDIFTLGGNDYLCTVDYYSDYFEVDPLNGSKDATAIIKKLKRHFSNHGIPDTVQTDNGPPFNSKQFENFGTQYGFDHTTSSPEYPQSNGKVENAVKIAKSLIKKTQHARGDFYLNLLNWRNTPTEGLGSSPAQRFLGRRTKTDIPVASKLLKPKIIRDVVSKKTKKQAKQSHYYDRNAKPLPPLCEGETVRFKQKRDSKVWQKAQVQKAVGIRSYQIITEDGREYRRNRQHLRKSAETFINIPQTASVPPLDPQITSQTSTPKRIEPQQRIASQTTKDTTTANSPPNAEPIIPRRSSRTRTAPKYLEQYVTK